MELKQQCVSLELAKKLKELGVKQESLFYWKFSNGMLEKVSNIDIDTELVYGKQPQKPKTLGTWDTCSAFTVAELGEMLPTHINKEKEKFYLHCTGSKGLKEWYVFYMSEEDYNPHLCSFLADTEVDARAKCLIYLLENNLIK